MHITFLARNNYPSIMINGITGFSGGIIVLRTAFYIEPWKRFDNIFLMLFYFLILIASNLICSNALTSLSKYYSYALMNITSLTLPLYVALAQYIIFGDKITSDIIIALILLFIGICIMYHDEFYNGFLKTTLLS